MLTEKDKQEIRKTIQQNNREFRKIVRQELEEAFRFQAFCESMQQQGKPALSLMQKEVLNIILQVPQGEGIIGSDICLKYKEKTHLDLPLSSLRGILKVLMGHYNVVNTRRIGYHIVINT